MGNMAGPGRLRTAGDFEKGDLMKSYIVVLFLIARVASAQVALPGLPDDTAGYEDWLKLNVQPIPPVPGGDPHRGTKNVYINQTLETIAPNGQQQFPYPDGTIVVKEATRPNRDFIGLIAVMWKEAGSNPAFGDWRFEEYLRGAPDAEFHLAFEGGVCTGCHSGAAATDFVFTQLEPREVVKPAPVVRITPSPVQSPYRGKQMTFTLDIANGENVVGYQASVQFDTSALRAVETAYGDYLPGEVLFVPASAEGGSVTFAATAISGVSNGDGTLATLTFEVVEPQASTLSLFDVVLTDRAGQTSSPRLENGQITAAVQLFGDVNRDGIVNVLDLVQVANRFGQRGEHDADVNEDGVVNIVDLVKVAGEFGNEAAAPSVHPQALAMLAPADVQRWLLEARGLDLTDSTVQRGIRFLEQLAAALTPKDTALFPNYPNPFNPETWIPYSLAKDAEVLITIYDTKGTVVRRFDLGHQGAGYYTDRTRAAYWDGRNANGEPVASGVYLYQLWTGDFTATRRMVILK
ncbi:T9SS type A sorting domain-containing protein [Candidatus Poribacteria bacterium]|nr:T9SS type A sorting domain-containing protein [Candidatus Poribacteria bacterium]